MDKEHVLLKIKETGLVAIVRTNDESSAVRYAEECIAGGVEVLEITFTVPGTHRVLERLSVRFEQQSYKNVVLGAGTVLDSETARIAILSGASFLVSPAINPEAIRLANRYRVPMLPGAQTARDVIEAMELGCDIIKLFPAENPRQITALKGPLPQARLMPTGGVTLENAAEWILCGAHALGVGSALKAKEGIKATAEAFLNKIKIARMNNQAHKD